MYIKKNIAQKQEHPSDTHIALRGVGDELVCCKGQVGESANNTFEREWIMGIAGVPFRLVPRRICHTVHHTSLQA